MKVLIIGGGQAGLGTAVALRKKDAALEIVLVDPKDYFEIRWASMRAFFDERIRDEYAVLYESVCVPWNITHVKDTVAALNQHSAKLSASGDTIEFDMCIVAVGARCPTLGIDPVATTLELRKNELVNAGKRMISSQGDVLVVGGGILGCETAGEICKPVLANGHKVIVASSSPEVVPELTARGRKLTTKVLERLGVEVLTGNRANALVEKDINNSSKWKVGDRVIEPALVLKCTGYSAQNEFMRAGDLPADCLNERGWINSDANFRVNGTQGRIYAFGDCCTTGSNRVAIVMANYDNIVHNIVSTLSQISVKEGSSKKEGCKKKALKVCDNKNASLKVCDDKNASMSVVTLGPDNGVADLPFAAIESLLPAYKNKTLFIDNAMSFVKKKKPGIWAWLPWGSSSEAT